VTTKPKASTWQVQAAKILKSLVHVVSNDDVSLNSRHTSAGPRTNQQKINQSGPDSIADL
jgi:hypothetical protein